MQDTDEFVLWAFCRTEPKLILTTSPFEEDIDRLMASPKKRGDETFVKVKLTGKLP